MALASLVSGIVPCAIGVGAGTPKVGASGSPQVFMQPGKGSGKRKGVGKGGGTPPQREQPGETQRMLHVLKMKLTKAKAHLAHLQGIERKKEEEYSKARDQAIEQARYLADIQTQHDDAFQRVVEGSLISSAKSDGPGIKDLSEDGALSHAMSDDDPDLAPWEWSQTGGVPAVAQKLPPPPDLP